MSLPRLRRPVAGSLALLAAAALLILAVTAGLIGHAPAESSPTPTALSRR